MNWNLKIRGQSNFTIQNQWNLKFNKYHMNNEKLVREAMTATIAFKWQGS